MYHARRAAALAIIVALSDILAGYLSPRLGFHEVWAPLLLGAVIAAAIITALTKFNPFFGIRQVRRFFHGEISTYEGFWISEVSHSGRPYSISKIYYNPRKNRWSSRGYAFSDDNKIVASWIGEGIHFDTHAKHWFFKGEWRVHPPGSHHGEGPTRDQFFKFKTNTDDPDLMHGVIIDNAEQARDPSPDPFSKTEILTSVAKRIKHEYFRELFCPEPNRIEELVRLTPSRCGEIYQRFFGATTP